MPVFSKCETMAPGHTQNIDGRPQVVKNRFRAKAVGLLLLLTLVVATDAVQATSAAYGVQEISGPCLVTNTDDDWKCAHVRLAEVRREPRDDGQTCRVQIRSRYLRWVCAAGSANDG